MCLLVSNQGFTLMLFSAKELKNHVIYTYTSVCIENVCTSGGRWPAYTLGTPRPRDATGQTGCVPLSLPKGVKPQPVRLKNKCREQMSTGKQLRQGAPPVPPATAASSDPPHRCRAGRKEGGESSRPRYMRIPKQTGRGRIPAHAQTAQGQGLGAGWYQARGKTSGCLIQPSAETEPMEALLWEAAPERQVASSFILG